MYMQKESLKKLPGFTILQAVKVLILRLLNRRIGWERMVRRAYSRTTGAIKLAIWLVHRNGGAYFFHSRFVDSIIDNNI